MPSLLERLNDTTPRKDDQNILTFQFHGYLVFLGRNSFSNERLIADHPHRDCLHMHAMAARGSHVILCIHEKITPDDSVIQYAARKALDHSHSQARTVSVALLKDLYKPEDAGPGVWKSKRRTSVEVL